ncbi:MAG: FAD-dependent oxidoreductase [Rhodospirillaceae bacterium]|jgi:glycine/D-amino acid oxidase-like deaminating enzyme|nr:FAD-dependent oxidoreductase [Rhodospirillaceae bacterium]MBT5899348.1 FAD-dependent oxidoreductase [Rhodospirillaceae bacterium]MBT6431338.1 FAD-dependent oxidoreductase [Rhodospirillaceae bacterium]MBT7759855.1 FAD-dependent oxidoreductase [Rhodospirillaceae bacterium]
MGTRADVVILGGGIAGLWLLDSLVRAGFSAVVLNKGDLGQGQSIAAQGIIHGGVKFVGETAVADLAPMPDLWRASLAGKSGPDLSMVKPLADNMHMWLPPQSVDSGLAMAVRNLARGTVRDCAIDERPSVLPPTAEGRLLEVDEVVIDVPQALAALQDRYRDRIFGLPDSGDVGLAARDDGGADITAGDMTIQAQRVVLTAGAGNETLLSQAGLNQIACQRRPLHQVMVRGMGQPIFMHCIGMNPKPLATITSYTDPEGGYFWYIGGLLAEQGVAQSPGQLIAKAKPELARLLPGADFSQAAWATHAVERAEPGGYGGSRPGSAVAKAHGAVIVGWPTKLALAPVLAEKIMGILNGGHLKPGPHDLSALSALPVPRVARPPWEMVQTWI